MAVFSISGSSLRFFSSWIEAIIGANERCVFQREGFVRPAVRHQLREDGLKGERTG
jgi:hypothetical protein